MAFRQFAKGIGILYRLLSVGIYCDNNGIRCKVGLDVRKPGFKGLAFSRVFDVIQDNRTRGTSVKNTATGIAASVINQYDHEAGIT